MTSEPRQEAKNAVLDDSNVITAPIPLNDTDMPSPISISAHSFANKIGRVLWRTVWFVVFRPSPKPMYFWRRWLLRRFGAKIGKGAVICSSCRVWAPWNLEMGVRSCLSYYVDCYCVAPIRIGDYATVSQYSFLCSASHDFEDPDMPVVSSPIRIRNRAWVCADVFVGPGVTIGEGAVIGARSTVVKNIPPWTIAVGNPCKPIKQRKIPQKQTT